MKQYQSSNFGNIRNKRVNDFLFTPNESVNATKPHTNASNSFVLKERPAFEEESADGESQQGKQPFIDFNWEENFAEEDILELPVEQFGRVIKLKAYRYPPKNYRKGVVFYIHGYGSYAN